MGLAERQEKRQKLAILGWNRSNIQTSYCKFNRTKFILVQSSEMMMTLIMMMMIMSSPLLSSNFPVTLRACVHVVPF